MWIMSQNFKVLCNAEKADDVRIEGNNIYSTSDGHYGLLGQYATEEEAVKVLKMLAGQVDFDGCYQMPRAGFKKNILRRLWLWLLYW